MTRRDLLRGLFLTPFAWFAPVPHPAPSLSAFVLTGPGYSEPGIAQRGIMFVGEDIAPAPRTYVRIKQKKLLDRVCIDPSAL